MKKCETIVLKCVLVFCRPTIANGNSKEQEELRADPAALANGTYDAPKKKGRQQEPPSHPPASNAGPSHSGKQQPGSSEQSGRQRDTSTDSRSNIHTNGRTDIKQQQTNGLPSSRAGQGPDPGGSGPVVGGDRPQSPASDSIQQHASNLLQLREALQTLPPSFAEAISRHVSCTNEALQKAEAERRVMMRSLNAAQSQLAVLPQMQVCARLSMYLKLCLHAYMAESYHIVYVLHPVAVF